MTIVRMPIEYGYHEVSACQHRRLLTRPRSPSVTGWCCEDCGGEWVTRDDDNQHLVDDNRDALGPVEAAIVGEQPPHGAQP